MRRIFITLIIFIIFIFPLVAADIKFDNLSVQYDTSNEDYCKVGLTLSKEVKNFSTVQNVESVTLKVDSQQADNTIFAVNETPLYLYTQILSANKISILVYLEDKLNAGDAVLDWYVAFANDGKYTNGYGDTKALVIEHMKDDKNILRLGTTELLIKTADLSSIKGGDYAGNIILEVRGV